jgi:N-methylhydantoinase B
MTNTSNLPIEVMENEFPLRLERYEMIPDSGGAGQHRGGLAVRREIRILAPGVKLATRCARQRFAATGLAGGKPGSLGAYIVNPGMPGERKLRPTVSDLPLAEGDLLCILSPGGGGFGDPHERALEKIRQDLGDGKITANAARAEYGCDGDEVSQNAAPHQEVLRPPAASLDHLVGAGEERGRDR